MSIIKVDGDRLWADLMQLAEIGAYTDGRTGLRGVNRLTLTDDDARGRRHVMDLMRAAGLHVRVDEMGNVFGRREGIDASAAPVLVGSHIDSVATAGAFDRCLGVLGGIEMVRLFNELGVTTQHPVEVAFFTEEEGVRFGVDMLGSAVAAGRIELSEAHALTDREGVSLVSELERHGFRGAEPVRMTPPHAYVECHIEQGPVLVAAEIDIGVVTGVQGISWQEVTIHGRSAHAGTTPTELRADAGLAAAEAIIELRAMVDLGQFGELRSTVGSIDVYPGLTNIVPSKATFTVDLRNPSDDDMERAEKHLAQFLSALAERWPGISVDVRRLAKTGHVPFDEHVQDVIADTVTGFGLTQQRIMSGAGHDAQEMAAICPSAMVFIPGEYDGISHNPREYSTPVACQRGVSVLATVVARLAVDVRPLT